MKAVRNIPKTASTDARAARVGVAKRPAEALVTMLLMLFGRTTLKLRR